MKYYKNNPYVKKYDENGNLKNPIDSALISRFPNRRERRRYEKQHELQAGQ